ncbi:MAG: response regulator transcription factor [Clostridia bacterium]|nr:response regulator transcription factor [Clostridia bacterium]
MTRIMILEDDEEQLNRLQDYIRRFEQENSGISLDIRAFTRATNLLENYRCDVDLLLLDIQVPDMTGMEMAKKIRQRDQGVMIIFITSLSQYAMEGYSVHAFDYILKPIRYDSFCAKMKLAFQMLSHQSQGVWLTLKTREKAQRVRSDEVVYIESSGHDIFVHTLQDVVKVWGTLTAFEEQLKEEYFVRCNSCYLVNLKYVRAVHGDFVTMEKDELVISKPKRKSFLLAIAQYQGGSR